MSRGLGPAQREILALVWNEYGGACLVSDIVESREGSDFYPANVGKPRYDEVYGGLSRILRNLHKRGLIRIFKEVRGNGAASAGGTAVFLSYEGVTVAQEITAKSAGVEK